jgi:hypothetical protein
MDSKRRGKIPGWAWRILITVVLLVGLPLLGVPVGFRLLHAWKGWETRSWQELGQPAQVPVAIMDADLEVVYVRGEKGALYACNHTEPTRDNACWEQIGQLPQTDSGVDHRNTYRDEIPPPPGEVQDVLDVSWDYAERHTQLRYVLLADGTVWLWDYHADANWSIALLMLGPVCGLALAIVIVVVMWLGAGLRALIRRLRAGP